jgi:hypothetical protein
MNEKKIKCPRTTILITIAFTAFNSSSPQGSEARSPGHIPIRNRMQGKTNHAKRTTDDGNVIEAVAVSIAGVQV